MNQQSLDQAFPTLTLAEIARIEPLGTVQTFYAGATIFRAGDSEVDLFIVKKGEIAIVSPLDESREVAVHHEGQFTGDIDLLTGRPVIVSGIAKTSSVTVLQIPNLKVREVLLRVPQISEKFITAFQLRREMLVSTGKVGIRVFGSADCKQTNLIREFLAKNFVPFVWTNEKSAAIDTLSSEFKEKDFPIVDCGGGKILKHPSLAELAACAGVWRECPTGIVDLAIVGAGPAGMSAAVYAASEGLSTLVLDSLGPGGQAAASSRIENFIGFPAGLSGTDLATRAVIQMLKFGAQIISPVTVEQLEIANGETEYHTLHLSCGSVARARVVLIATGLTWKKIPALNSDKFELTGIYYACTSTEALTHQGEDIAVAGAGNSAGQAAMYLAEQCARTVHLLVRGKDLTASMSNYLVDRILSTPNITVHLGVEIVGILGEAHLTGVQLKHHSSESSVLDISALFVFIGAEPAAKWLSNEVVRDQKGYILTGADALATGEWPLSDRQPCTLETTIPNLLAAGDIRSNSTKRVGFAVGDGALAIACVHSLRMSPRRSKTKL